MPDLRHFFDLTFWDKSGSSWMGLKRNQAKILATIFILLGILLATPPGIGVPFDDLLNFFLAGVLVRWFPSIPYLTILALTYTVIAWGIILLGLWIFPYNTESLINGYVNKAQRFVSRALKSPKTLAVIIISGWLLYHLYATYLLKGI